MRQVRNLNEFQSQLDRFQWVKFTLILTFPDLPIIELSQFWQNLKLYECAYCFWNLSMLPNDPDQTSNWNNLVLVWRLLRVQKSEVRTNVNKMLSHLICQRTLLPKLTKISIEKYPFPHEQKIGSPISNTFPLHFPHYITKKRKIK